jgi:hypothetical protein
VVVWRAILRGFTGETPVPLSNQVVSPGFILKPNRPAERKNA